MKAAQVILAALAFFAVRVALAAGATKGVPWTELIIPQLVNVTIVVVGLSYLLRKPLANYFATKAAAFEEHKAVAERVRQEAEAKNSQIKSLITNVEATAEKSLTEAKNEAESLRQQLVKDAAEQAKKIEEETGKMGQYEFDRAISLLRTELVTNSVRFAENKMKENMSRDVQQKLNEEFISKVGALKI